ncbi:hypothetical protein Q3A66_10940 [Hymenobacter sp. BT770]|uniref:hypothetical protein n=1 Tax=Hymenobacter sp. BT770 TaxID=2886942 RepID=UPI001D10C2C7|nr:hypothetical protein [Hymenobacter sp. BT770]MCC3154890.1 hypothetical protein [Hymenobacter sp. BT770]MDO3415585.1 hypothetical protein [Hymenobacter sp. BT770]
MDTKKNNSLENFVERHRADFDTHEPRPDLWAALEQKLADPAAAPSVPPAMRRADAGQLAPQAVAVAAAGPVRPASWLQRYGVAAALALLVFAAGASEAWKTRHAAPAELTAATSPASSTSAPEAPDAALYQGGNPVAMAATDRTIGADSQLVRAVRGMEAYYTTQLARRQSELRELKGPGVAGMNADWQRELVSLDSSYRKLKVELLHHPQPDAVLTAMNRNLQIRLDILDQQLHIGTAPQEEERSTGSFVLADSQHSSR